MWADAPSTGDFVRTMDGQPAEQKTQAKLLWDDKNLYVAFINEDKDIWTTLDKHDDKLWTQEADEMFIDADGDGKTYVELQVNAKGATFDSYLPTYRQNQNDWDSGMKAGVHDRRHAQQARRRGQALDRRAGDSARGGEGQREGHEERAAQGGHRVARELLPHGSADRPPAVGHRLVGADGRRLPRAR